MPRPLADFFSRLGPALLPWRCLVCTEPGDDGLDLCPACRRDLPWNRPACTRCGLPLPRPAPRCGRCLGSRPPQASTHAVFRYAPPLDRLLPRDDRQRCDVDLGAEDGELFLRGRAIDVERRHQHLFAVFFLEPLGDLRGRRSGRPQSLGQEGYLGLLLFILAARCHTSISA